MTCKQSIRSHPIAIGLIGVYSSFLRTPLGPYWSDGKRIFAFAFFYFMKTGTPGTGLSDILWRESAISELFINEQIRDKEIRLIGEDGAQLGIMSPRDAMKLAEEAGLDLVKIAPTAKPPVCKIVDYGKYRYEMARREKDAKKKQKTIEIKEIRMSPNIDTNDLNTKASAARKFIEKGIRVKITLRFRGREMAHMSTSKHILDDFAQMLSDIAVVEKQPKVEGRSMIMFLTEKR